ncbi:hypothetical protein GGR16_000194 [Chelatococcus caeni]|uniref:DUF1326 domain-containing protein n=1 Tax=Chelatococcus caeni TaxID=1348468 RepID=A0A840BUL1_9HYPH|nr:DUF1326 domain-containing protein [Chelatococcus caeni]MBB4015188.1 hypothetical protein [Chelatococcus caeni]
MADAVEWSIRARFFVNFNCAHDCPYQFDMLPSHGPCRGVAAFEIDEGRYGSVALDRLKAVVAFSWPGAISEGGGQVLTVIDERAAPDQRAALMRIMGGEDASPGADFFRIFAATVETRHGPLFSAIEFEIDIDQRRAAVVVPGVIDSRGEPLHDGSGRVRRVRVDMPEGFEHRQAEVGRGWTRMSGPMPMRLTDAHGLFARLDLSADPAPRPVPTVAESTP